MLPTISDFLMLSEEPAVLIQCGRLRQVNGSAAELLGRSCEGKSVREVFGEEIAEAQAPHFVADIRLNGQNRTVRVTRFEGVQIIYISRPDRDLAVISEASLASLRGSLMNLSLLVERGRTRAEELGDAALCDCFTGVTRQYYALKRLVSNSAIVYALLRGELATTMTAIDLASLCRTTVETLSGFLPSLSIRLSAPVTLPIYADRVLLETLLLNLLSNALLHARGLQTLSLTLSETERSAIISLSDDGCGIAPEELPTVFSRYRCEPGLSTLSRGAGLGLSVARGVAAKHGGTLLLESREGRGTTVRVSLSRTPGAGVSLHTPLPETRCDMETLLTGLADCLPDACCSARYLD